MTSPGTSSRSADSEAAHAPEWELPADLRAWIEATVSGRVVAAARHFAGASREAWSVDVELDGGPAADGFGALFLLKDKGEGGGSARDAAVLHALAPTEVPVPRVVGVSASPPMLLLERLAGRSDFPGVDHASEREPTARHLMELTAALHALDPATLRVPHLAVPENSAEEARRTLAEARGALKMLGDLADPFFTFALDWLESHVPAESSVLSLVHSDMGPGNFLFSGGRVTGIVDWEVAHFGDPMEDLAAIAVRDMATPVGDLSKRFEEYERAGGSPVSLERVDYYRALVLVRNSLMIGLGLAQPAEGFDVVEMTMYQTLLMRGAALSLCDNLGIPRPSVADSIPAGADGGGDGEAATHAGVRRASLIAYLNRSLEEIDSSDGGAIAARACLGVGRGLAWLEHERLVGSELVRRENSEIEAVLGIDEASQAEEGAFSSNRLEHQLGEQVSLGGAHRSGEAALAEYFARRMHRLAERHRPLLGDLYERLPQPLAPATPLSAEALGESK